MTLGERNRDRIKSAAGAAAFHALLGYALIIGLGVSIPARVADRLTMVSVLPEPPPPPPIDEPPPVARKRPAREARASQPNLKSSASPVVAPRPVVPLEVPPPLSAAPVPDRGGALAQGASALPGPGSGSGGEGNGTGSGGSGSGTGGGGARAAARARLVSGRIDDEDYPRAAARARIGGVVVVRLAVAADGHVAGCAVSLSSGNADLDSTTCRLATLRFRYAPARDSGGRAVPDVQGWKQSWWLEPRGLAAR